METCLNSEANIQRYSHMLFAISEKGGRKCGSLKGSLAHLLIAIETSLELVVDWGNELALYKLDFA